MPLTDPLLLFLPEALEDPVVADSNQGDPRPEEVQRKPQIPTVLEPSHARLVVVPVTTRPVIDDPIRPAHAQRPHLLFRCLLHAARLTFTVVRLAREHGAHLIRRSAAVVAASAQAILRVGGGFATHVRAARYRCSVAAELATARLTSLVRNIKSERAAARHARVVRQSERQRRQPSPPRARAGLSYPAGPRNLSRHRAMARVDRLSKVRTLGMNTWPIGFVCGIAAGALGMWLFNVPPAALGTTAASDAAPALTMHPVPAATAPAESVSGETPAAPVVDVVVPAVSTLLAGVAPDQRDRAESRLAARPLAESRPAARPPREANPPGELSSTDALLMRFTGTLAVHSWPPGARVFVGGAAVGTAPIVLRDLPVGSRVVRLEAEGYQTWSAAVRVIANEQTRVTGTLYRDPALP